MNKHSRLDGLLARNRKHVIVDLALAAIFPIALLLSGMAVGSTASAAPAAPAAATANASDASTQSCLHPAV